MRNKKTRVIQIIFCLFVTFCVTAQTSSIQTGIYQNKNKFIQINEDSSISETLKNFYAYYYDGEFKINQTIEELPFYVDDSGLYLQYFKKSELSVLLSDFTNSENELNGYWIPCGNLYDITINEQRKKEKLQAYLILQNPSTQIIYEIEYWLTDQEYKEELAIIQLPQFERLSKTQDTFELSENPQTEQIDENAEFYVTDETQENIVKVEKYLKIGDSVYTSTVGRRTKIRNPKFLQELPNETSLNSEKNILVFGNPDFSKVTNIPDSLQEEINRHNSVIYPPRFSVLEFKEPKIYQKL